MADTDIQFADTDISAKSVSAKYIGPTLQGGQAKDQIDKITNSRTGQEEVNLTIDQEVKSKISRAGNMWLGLRKSEEAEEKIKEKLKQTGLN